MAKVKFGPLPCLDCLLIDLSNCFSAVILLLPRVHSFARE